MRCSVKTAAYYGDRMEYQLILGTQIISASSSLSLRLAPGDTAMVEFDTDAIMLASIWHPYQISPSRYRLVPVEGYQEEALMICVPISTVFAYSHRNEPPS